jgi:HKD family nuclease
MAPSLRFRGQPFHQGDTVGAFLTEALADTGIERLTMVVAWARLGGLGRVKSELDAFRSRGGRVRLILGIDEGVATRPGLLAAIEMTDEPYVLHNRGARTFHPKLYLAEGTEKVVVLAGSSNLTAGGLFSNYEASLEAEFELPAEADSDAIVGAREYIEKLLADEELCLSLDAELLDRLLDDSRYSISKGERREPGRARDAGEAIFGSSRHVLVTPPKLSSEKQAEGGFDETGVVSTAVETWIKKPLRPSNVQQSPSHQVGSLRLTNSGNAIKCQTWFRYEMFGGEAWTDGQDENGNPKETTVIPFEVTIDGSSHGLVELEVDHAPHRESDQDNHATLLRWGDLSPTLRATDYTDYTLTIQRMSDGTYRLDISK